MAIFAALFMLCLIVRVTFAAQTTCQNSIRCPCGSTNTNITVCIQAADDDPCRKWARCKTCRDGLDSCLQCPEGLEGPFCSKEIAQKKSRPKRQYRYTTYGRLQERHGHNQHTHHHSHSSPDQYQRRSSAQQNLYSRNPAAQSGYCSNLESPKLGGIRCFSEDQRRTCTGTCLPGYSFENYNTDEEITLTCNGGIWTPLSSFPECKSGGHCDLTVEGAGSFNCTTGMSGTRCDVICSNRYAGRYFCYPGQPWEPPLPYCVKPKSSVVESRQPCHCEYGATCGSNGNCVCPAGRTGPRCEQIERYISETMYCLSPGRILNGRVVHVPLSMSRNLENAEDLANEYPPNSVLEYSCNVGYTLHGVDTLVCEESGFWSSSPPMCVHEDHMCPDPGQVANADRLNTDGSPSRGVQRYRVGQSVAYSCHPGFALHHQSLITCLDSGTWSSITPHCMPVTPVPDFITITTENPDVTVSFCQDPGTDPNGRRQPSNRRRFPLGMELVYSCNQGYRLVGQERIFCVTSGRWPRWSDSRPRCEAVLPSPGNDGETELAYCANPGPISNGQVVHYPSINNRRRVTPQPVNFDEPEYPEGSSLEFSCNSGYTLQGRAAVICEKSGRWSSQPPVCRREDTRRPCENPGGVRNGLVVNVPTWGMITGRVRVTTDDDGMLRQYTPGSRIQYSCKAGYTLEGNATLICEDSGSWSARPPTCKSVSGKDILYCANPGIILNGQVKTFSSAVNGRNRQDAGDDNVEEEFPEGTRLEYSCDKGYELTGSNTTTCLEAGHWFPDPPTCVGECGRTFIQATRKVLHGDRTVSGAWPWVVAISVEGTSDYRLICAGAVLNSRTVITAAHCLESAGPLGLRFGKFHRKLRDDDTSVQFRKSSRVIIHPDYRNSTYDSDIGLVMFEESIHYDKKVQPICLPTAESTAKDIMTGKKGYVSAWGITERNLQSDELMLASLPVVTNRVCMDSFRQHNMTLSLTANMFCAGYSDAKQSACQGDSGAPLVFFDSLAQKFILEGLVSFGAEGQCGETGKYTIFTKVFQFLPWILRNIR